ncbi:BCL2 like 16 [Anabas testudineus]|uniref:BCL2 like 16 n=1 Tax=Anabas testudineus TaxID=64144 RepID=UPI00143DE239|nr:BCL2 like 16 [Anabas testudineus]
MAALLAFLQPCSCASQMLFPMTRCWPRIFNDVTEKTSCPILISILDEHFFPQVLGGRCRDLAWSAVLSVYVLAGQMALHYHRRGMTVVLSQLKECVGAYMKRVICSEIQDKGGLTDFMLCFERSRTWRAS